MRIPLSLKANSSLRDRIGQFIKKRREFVKLEIRIIEISTFLVFVVTANNLLIHGVRGLTQNSGFAALKDLLLILLAGMVFFIVLLTSITYLMIVIRDRNKDVANLKRAVTQAYSKALDQSSFNPHRVEPHDERPNP